MANDWSAVNADNRLQVIQYRFILVKCCLTEVVETTPRLCLAQVNSREMADCCEFLQGHLLSDRKWDIFARKKGKYLNLSATRKLF